MTDATTHTLMTVHAHPDDETIGTGGVMAMAVANGHRVVLVTCTRGEQGEIVIPELDTPENHRRLGEIRAGELEAALGRLGVTEWESLGYRDSDMMGRPANRDPRNFWNAPLDEAARRLVFLVRTYRPDVITTYNSFGGYGHPDHIRTHDVAVAAFARAGDAVWYPEQLAPEHGGTGPAADEAGLAPWAAAKLYEQAMPLSLRRDMNARMEAIGERSIWMAPADASPEQIAEHDAYLEKMLVRDEDITTRVDVDMWLAAKWSALREHRTQIAEKNAFMRFGLEAWREFWRHESFVRRECRIPAPDRETDLFEGLADARPGPLGWARLAQG